MKREDMLARLLAQAETEGSDLITLRAIVEEASDLGAKRVLERMDAFLDETDDQGRMPSTGKIAVCAIVGNEDGAHASSALMFQALNDVGWTIPPGAACYWVGEAMGDKDFKDLKKTPDVVQETAAMLASKAAHLAALLQQKPFPGVEE